MQIVLLKEADKPAFLRLFRAVAANLREKGIDQWDFFYPNRFTLYGDLRRGAAFGIKDGENIIGAVTVDFILSGKYAELPWSDGAGRPAGIHRLAVHPSRQGEGVGKKLLQFAEERSQGLGATSIRLDVYSLNPGAVRMYEKAGYLQVGSVRYPMRKAPYLCFEKKL